VKQKNARLGCYCDPYLVGYLESAAALKPLLGDKYQYVSLKFFSVGFGQTAVISHIPVENLEPCGGKFLVAESFASPSFQQEHLQVLLWSATRLPIYTRDYSKYPSARYLRPYRSQLAEPPETNLDNSLRKRYLDASFRDILVCFEKGSLF
jgi:hypothetical protein